MKTLKRIVELLEAIHLDLQVANWQRGGCKGPQPGTDETGKILSFGNKVVYTINTVNTDEAIAALRNRKPGNGEATAR